MVDSLSDSTLARPDQLYVLCDVTVLDAPESADMLRRTGDCHALLLASENRAMGDATEAPSRGLPVRLLASCCGWGRSLAAGDTAIGLVGWSRAGAARVGVPGGDVGRPAPLGTDVVVVVDVDVVAAMRGTDGVVGRAGAAARLFTMLAEELTVAAAVGLLAAGCAAPTLACAWRRPMLDLLPTGRGGAMAEPAADRELLTVDAERMEGESPVGRENGGGGGGGGAGGGVSVLSTVAGAHMCGAAEAGSLDALTAAGDE